jgi:hypothetical protein
MFVWNNLAKKWDIMKRHGKGVKPESVKGTWKAIARKIREKRIIKGENMAAGCGTLGVGVTLYVCPC